MRVWMQHREIGSAFVDSDDTAAPEYLEKMHKAVLETGADFAICSSQCIDETGKTLAGGEHRLLNEFLPQKEVLRPDGGVGFSGSVE